MYLLICNPNMGGFVRINGDIPQSVRLNPLTHCIGYVGLDNRDIVVIDHCPAMVVPTYADARRDRAYFNTTAEWNEDLGGFVLVVDGFRASRVRGITPAPTPEDSQVPSVASIVAGRIVD